jgi:mRNA interferase HigB
MHVISEKKLKAFWAIHPDAERPLRNWLRLMEQGRFLDFTSIRAIWASADYVDGLIVFNIGGNKYRLIADIRYHLGRAYIREMLTHAEYDRGLWKRSK